MKTKKIQFVTILYSIGVLLVLFGHSHYSNWDGNFIYESVNSFIYKFHMPLFFWIAGFLFLNSTKIYQEGYFKWICKKCLRLIVPYLVLSLLFVIPKNYFETRSFVNVANNTLSLFIRPRDGVWGHFWFIPCLFSIYVIFGIIRCYVPKTNTTKACIIISLLFLIIYFSRTNTDYLGINDLRKYAVFFSIGMSCFQIQKNKKELRFKKPLYLLISLPFIVASVFLFINYNFVAGVDFIIAICMIFACICIAKIFTNNKALNYIGTRSYSIYLYSWIVQSFAMAVLSHFNINWLIALPVMFLVGLFIPLLIRFLYDKNTKVHNKFFDLILGI